MALIKVPEGRRGEMFTEFFNNSCLTYEGVDISKKKGVKELEKLIMDNGFEGKEVLVYWFDGKTMNECFNLTGSNAYPDDLTFLVIPDFYNVGFKIRTGGRWFDDIISNNRIKQNSINHNSPVDFDVENCDIIKVEEN